MRARLKARQQLKALLLRHGHRYSGKSSWTLAHERYLSSVTFEHRAQDIAFTEYRSAVREAHERVERLTESLRAQLESWRMRPVVEALMSLRGIDVVAAVTLVAEIGDIRRFTHPRELMSFLGLVPSEHSSGQTRRLGAITKCGNGHARPPGRAAQADREPVPRHVPGVQSAQSAAASGRGMSGSFII